jgi:ribulose-5-phosphate 4-epimerase/fuculose-1-phosphate aldolase
VTEQELREQLVAFGASLFQRGYSVGSAGNISVRLEDGYLMTPTNSSLGRLDPARISKLDRSGSISAATSLPRKSSCTVPC